MKQFDPQYSLLEEMYADGYYPDFLVDKIKALLEELIVYLEQGPHANEAIQAQLDEMTLSINALQTEFEENDSEIETVARDAIAVTVEYILHWFGVDIDIETALQERDW